ncbi:MAG TPA: DNA replication/repair protein RecF [Chloroflexi bacterium]|nr:DNA replication/repair protein RecF [Chloroflexota bacterium]
MAAAMRLQRLTLANFRNFRQLEVEFPAGAIIVVGDNAQGKSNLLEAIHYLTGGVPAHASQDRELIHFDAWALSRPFARAVGEIETRDQDLHIEIRIVMDPTHANSRRLRKEILINGQKRRRRELTGRFSAVLFLPHDLEMVEGAPVNRRRFLDDMLSQADPQYADDLIEYGKVLTQRNALLRTLQERRGTPDQLAYWDERLCELAASLIRRRAHALLELDRLGHALHGELTRESERLRLIYKPRLAPNNHAGEATPPAGLDIAAADLSASLRASLERHRRLEIQRGMTLIGPHRDDFQFLANDVDLRLFGSRGQNRTATLSLKLAEVEWLHERLQEWPLLLLDEVLAELDLSRRQDLLSRLGAAPQVVLTATDPAMFPDAFLAAATLWRIRAGVLSPFAT